MGKLELYQRRSEKTKQEKSLIKLVGTNGREINPEDFLPVVYSVWLGNGAEEEVLYVGKSRLFSTREASHIVAVLDNPAYFGLTEEDLTNENLILKFKIEEKVDVLRLKTIYELDQRLSEKEKEFVDKLKPITMKGMMMKDQEEKRRSVKALIQKLSKE